MVEPLSVSPPPVPPQPVTPEKTQAVSLSAPAAPVTTTPAAAEMGEFAGFGTRFLAMLFDLVVVVILDFMLGFALTFIFGIGAGISSGVSKQPVTDIFMMPAFFFAIQISGLVVTFLYFIILTGRRGQTLGKMALKIKVVKLDTGEPPGYLVAFIREVVGEIISFLVFGLGYLWVIWDKKKQAWHDKIAGTVVVKL